ncbi:MAG: hypothetical protein KGY54_10120 [Oleiphilaceae bacterium]|nr:hypothetical protein [Oleiphilaceae bacterium]
MTSALTSSGSSSPTDVPSELSEQTGHLIIALEAILRESPRGVSELTLIKALQAAPWQLLGKVDFTSPTQLYPVHFLVFHGLYRLRDELGGKGETLSISPLLIRLGTSDVVAGHGPLAESDKLREFYLDLSQYSLSEQAISAMMNDFWAGRTSQRPAPDDAREAARVLGLQQLPASFDEVKHRFRRAVMQAHPDRGGSTEDVQALNEAFGTLRIFFTDPPT